MHTNASGSAQAQAELRIGSQTTERFGQTVHGRPGPIRRHSDAGLIRNLKGRRPEVEADDRPARRHRVKAGLSAGIPQRRMNQDMALPERVDHLGARNSTGKVDPVGDPCAPREPLQPPALRAVTDHPIFGVGEGRPGEGGETERETAAGPQGADADEPDRRAGRLRQACKRIARFGCEPRPPRNSTRAAPSARTLAAVSLVVARTIALRRAVSRTSGSWAAIWRPSAPSHAVIQPGRSRPVRKPGRVDSSPSTGPHTCGTGSRASRPGAVQSAGPTW